MSAKLSTFTGGGDRSKTQNGDLKLNQASQMLNVGERTVQLADIPRYHPVI